MEKKVTRRIIGILVVVALVIILLPLMNINDSQSNLQTSEVKAPPFPDPQNENTQAAAPADTAANTTTQPDAPKAPVVASNNNMSIHSIIENFISSKKPAVEKEKPTPVAASTPATPPADTATQTVAANNPAAPVPEVQNVPQEETLASNSATDPEEEIEQVDNTVTPTRHATVVADNAQPKIDAAIAPVKSDASTALNTPSQAPAVETAPKMQPVAANIKPQSEPTVISNVEPSVEATATPQPVMEVTRTVTKTVIAKTQPPKVTTIKAKPVIENEDDEEDDIAQAKQTAWVVQMGSFKNKVNAERLTNTLRAKGYKAFTYETKSNGQTRVYVGPQYKQVAAANIASKIESDMKMHGIVVSFKPLEL